MLAALVLVVMNVVSVADVQNPRPTHWVTDQANVLDAPTEAKLDAIADELHALRGIELAVVTVSDTRETPKQFATALFNRWGIGSAQTNNGVLVLLVMSKRRLEIETGTGMEGALPAAWLADMQAREMVPSFKARRFGDGLVAGVTAISAHLAAAPGESASTAQPGEYRSNGEVVAQPPAAPVTDPAPGAASSSPQPSAAPPSSDGGVPALPFALGGLGLVGGGAAFGLRRRRKNRTCETCTPTQRMIPLDEVADDAHLDPGQVTEEQVSSVDYEVLVCPQCQGVRTLRHGRWFSGYGRCWSCNYKTSKSTSQTLVSATYDHGGQVRVTDTCAHCSHTTSRIRSTARLTRSTSSSSSSGGSSRGGSGFSGGSSRGGGAGSSW